MMNTSRTAAENRATVRLNRVTALATSWDRWDDMVAACEAGYVPSLRRDDLLQDILGEELESRGFRVYWG